MTSSPTAREAAVLSSEALEAIRKRAEVNFHCRTDLRDLLSHIAALEAVSLARERQVWLAAAEVARTAVYPEHVGTTSEDDRVVWKPIPLREEIAAALEAKAP